MVWSETWHPLESWVAELEGALLRSQTVLIRGGDFDRWDLDLRGGLFGRARILTGVEEHGSGRQLVRFRAWPWPTRVALFSALILTSLAIAAALGAAPHAAAVLGLFLVVVVSATALDCARAIGSAKRAADGLAEVTLLADAADAE